MTLDSSNKSLNSISRCQALLGTYVEINISSEKKDDELLEMTNIAFAKIKEIENLMSFHDINSELSHINREAFNGACAISASMNDVLTQAISLSNKTNGIYDISIAPQLMKQNLLPNHYISSDPSANWQDISLKDNKIKFNKELQIDLGGIAKGYAVDQALSLIEDGLSDITINAGGDLAMSNWESKVIEINYSNKNSKITSLMKRKALASSALYYLDGKSSIISTSSRKPILCDDTISVFAPNCMLADALTKVVFLQGQECLSLLDDLDSIAIITNKDGFSKYLSGEIL